MARLLISSRKRKIIVMLESFRIILNLVVKLYTMVCIEAAHHYKKHVLKLTSPFTVFAREEIMYRLVWCSDSVCRHHFRMDRYTFTKLCSMLRTIGKLQDTKKVSVEEMVAMFLHILAHHVKNRVIKNRFLRSGETVSRCFNIVLNGVMLLQSHLLKKPEAVSETSSDFTWKWFKNCLGALDGTYIRINVPEEDKARYRTRKSDIATNVLGVCSQDMQFIYVLSGWEGSAADSRVLRDAVSRRNGLKIPHGFYYLVDAGYPNVDGFLAPYRGQRYHLNVWKEGYQPTTPQEYFNMKHSSARNVIERCFGLLKLRWAILRSPSFYPVKTHNRIIIACCLLHNLIRQEMPVDPLEKDLEKRMRNYSNTTSNAGPISHINASDQWSTMRDNLANDMFNEWMASRGA